MSHYLNLDLAVLPLFYQMTKRGIAVDLHAMESLLEDVQQEQDIARAELDIAAPGLNPGSAAQISDWMIKEGLTGKLTKSKAQLATDEASLASHKHPVLDMVLKFREMDKLAGTFIEPVIEKAAKSCSENSGLRWGVIHPRWRLTKVKSGRVAMEDPNLLAFPARGFGLRVRECFVARPGYKLVSVDFAQLEPRVVAALADEPALKRVFAAGEDLYGTIASELKITRQTAKVVTLAVLYGMSAPALQEQLASAGVMLTKMECEALIRQWLDAYPQVAKMRGGVIETAKLCGTAETFGGRQRAVYAAQAKGYGYPVSKYREEAERQAFNHRIQGTAAEMVKEAMLRVAHAVPEAHPLLQIHDEMIYEVPEAGAELTADRIAASMRVVFLGVSLETSTGVGSNWGELK